MLIKSIFVPIIITPSILLSSYFFVKKEPRHTLVFDLDNTLISSEKIKKYNMHNNSNISKHDYMTQLKDFSEDEQYLVWKRPYVDFTLNILSNFTNIYFYTAASEEYANDIISGCFPKYYKKNNIYHRNHWIIDNKSKNLQRINKSNNITLIDDKLYNHNEGQSFYHIPQFYYYNNNDCEMIKLLFNIIKKIM